MRTYTPLRYPGGKSRLYNYTKELIENNYENPPIYAEAFAGGSGLALKLLSTGVVSKIYINDFDYAVYCIWYSLKYQNKKFRKLVNNVTFSIEEWDRQKAIYLTANEGSKSTHSKLEIGFATFYLNRTNRSGILTAGPIGGRDQTGNYPMYCRFNKKDLIEIIDNINKHKSKIHVYNKDAYRFIKIIDNRYDANCFFYLDPPYVQNGPALYKNSFDEKKHTELRDSVITLRNKWFMTYDSDPLIKSLYHGYNMHTYQLSYAAQTSKLGTEYALFSKNMVYVNHITIPSTLK